VRFTIEAPLRRTAVRVAWRTPALGEPGDAELDLVADALSGREGLLMRRMNRRDDVSSDPDANQRSLALGSVFEISATAIGNHTADDVLESLDGALAELRLHPPSGARLEALKRARVLSILSQNQDLAARAGVEAASDERNGNPDYLDREVERYASVTDERVRTAIDTWLRPESRFVEYIRSNLRAPIPGRRASRQHVSRRGQS
jgi:predicted Zn-dependent peptidase